MIHVARMSVARALVRRSLFLLPVLACLGACAQDVPASLLLTVLDGDGAPAADSVRVRVFDDSGLAYEAATFTVRASGGNLGTVTIYPHRRDALGLRIQAEGLHDNVAVSRGTTTATLVDGQQKSAQVTLRGEPAADGDLDGVPDEIDNCPQVSNPQQEDERRDGHGDACRSGDPDGGGDDTSVPVDAIGGRATGTACSASAQCETGHCVGDVCCESACTGVCRSCNLAGRVGQCAPVPAGQEDPRAGCNKEAVASCGFDGTCDGTGACRKYPAGFECRPGSCSGSDRILPGTCDGQGVCAAARTQSCAPFSCAGTGCAQTCNGTMGCAAGIACVNGSCGKQPLGAPCAAGTACNSGNCVDGVCCDVATCSGPCRACNLPGSAGSCQSIAANGQPRSAGCESEAPETCGRSGKCDGAGGCQLHPPGIPCGALSCTAANEVSTSTCNGAGVCQVSSVVACGNYLCGATTGCHTSCTSNADCVSAAFCQLATHLCASKLANGAVCTAASACQSGSCVDGHCCQTSSCATGKACIGAGGTCTTQIALGQACSTGGECQSGFCADGVCCNSACTQTCRSCDVTPGQCLVLDVGRDANATSPCNAPKRCTTGGICR
jgi:hypothetical protein